MKVEVTGFEMLPEMINEDPYFVKYGEKVKDGSTDEFMLVDGFLFKGNRLCIPDCSLRMKIVKELHEEGHVGRDRTLQLISQSYF